MRPPVGVAEKTRIGGHFRPAEQFAEIAELRVVAACDEDLAGARADISQYGAMFGCALPVGIGRLPLRK